MELTQEQRTYSINVAGAIVTELFKLLQSEGVSNGDAVRNQILYNVAGSILSTELHHQLMKTNNGDESDQVYVFHKRAIEGMVEQSFMRVFELINPGTHPDFQCNVVLLDDGTQLSKDA